MWKTRAARALGALVALAFCAATAGAVTSARPRAVQPAAARPVPGDRLAGFADSAVFLRYYRDQIWGAVECRWDSSGRFRSRPLRGRPGLGGDVVRIEPDSSGAWRTVWIGMPRDSAYLEREGAKAALHGEGRVDTLAVEPGTLLVGPPALLAQVARAWDARRGGAQPRPILILPIHQRQATVERLERVTRRVRGRAETFRRWRLAAHGADYALWLDSRGRLCLADDRAQETGWVREGYEALRGPEHAKARELFKPAATPPRRDSVRGDSPRIAPAAPESTRRR